MLICMPKDKQMDYYEVGTFFVTNPVKHCLAASSVGYAWHEVA